MQASLGAPSPDGELGPIPPETLREAAAQSQKSPLGVYSLAVLEVAPGKMSQFIAGLEAAAPVLPIVESWRTIVGKQNEMTDIWKGVMRQSGYQPPAGSVAPIRVRPLGSCVTTVWQ